MMMDELCISMLVVLLSVAIGRILTEDLGVLEEVTSER